MFIDVMIMQQVRIAIVMSYLVCFLSLHLMEKVYRGGLVDLVYRNPC